MTSVWPGEVSSGWFASTGWDPATNAQAVRRHLSATPGFVAPHRGAFPTPPPPPLATKMPLLARTSLGLRIPAQELLDIADQVVRFRQRVGG